MKIAGLEVLTWRLQEAGTTGASWKGSCGYFSKMSDLR